MNATETSPATTPGIDDESVAGGVDNRSEKDRACVPNDRETGELQADFAGRDILEIERQEAFVKQLVDKYLDDVELPNTRSGWAQRIRSYVIEAMCQARFDAKRLASKYPTDFRPDDASIGPKFHLKLEDESDFAAVVPGVLPNVGSVIRLDDGSHVYVTVVVPSRDPIVQGKRISW